MGDNSEEKCDHTILSRTAAVYEGKHHWDDKHCLLCGEAVKLLNEVK